MSQTDLIPPLPVAHPIEAAVKPAVWLMATGNAHKASELQLGLQQAGWPITIKTPPAELLDSLEENGTTFIANAQLKAAHLLAYAQSIKAEAVLGDDSGLVLPALQGYLGLSPFPGLHSNRWLTGELKVELLGGERTLSPSHYDKCLAILHLLKGKVAAERRGSFVCALALMPVTRSSSGLLAPISLQKEFAIEIIDEALPRGQNGFGYDAIALPIDVETGLPLAQTVAESPEAFKQKHSHRALALEALLEALKQRLNQPAAL
jgi:non-canonical purine NTP pyrophosphatase (RdgB/HAM1 family)